MGILYVCIFVFKYAFWIFHVINVFIFHKMYTLSKSSTTLVLCYLHFKLGLLYVYFYRSYNIYIFLIFFININKSIYGLNIDD